MLVGVQHLGCPVYLVLLFLLALPLFFGFLCLFSATPTASGWITIGVMSILKVTDRPVDILRRRVEVTVMNLILTAFVHIDTNFNTSFSMPSTHPRTVYKDLLALLDTSKILFFRSRPRVSVAV